MTLSFMQTIKGTKSAIKTGIVRLNFGDTHQVKNYLNTLKIENIDGADKYMKLNIQLLCRKTHEK